MSTNTAQQGSIMIRNFVVFVVLAIAAATLAQDNQPASQPQGGAQSTQPAQPASAPAQPAASQVQTTSAPSQPATVLKFTSRLVVVNRLRNILCLVPEFTTNAQLLNVPLYNLHGQHLQMLNTPARSPHIPSTSGLAQESITPPMLQEVLQLQK